MQMRSMIRTFEPSNQVWQGIGNGENEYDNVPIILIFTSIWPQQQQQQYKM